MELKNKVKKISDVVCEVLKGRSVCYTTPKSSNIACWHYSFETKKLNILFKKGTSYTYFNVGLEVPLKLIMNDSVGKEFHNSILGKYKYEKYTKDMILK